MNDNFTDLMDKTFSSDEVAAMQDEAEYADFQNEVQKVYRALSGMTDALAESTDIYVVGAALEMLSNEYDHMTGGDSDA